MKASTALTLRRDAAGAAAGLPALLAAAERLAQTVMPGVHGRRRAGQGDEFWQYRPATETDAPRHIDWRRSAKSDGNFIRQKEWQLAQSVMFLVDPGASMRWASHKDLPQKSHRAAVLALACSMLLQRGGERFGLIGPEAILPRTGEVQIMRMAQALSPTIDAPQDFTTYDLTSLRPDTQLVMISDFLGDPSAFTRAADQAAGLGARGVFLQILDPAEEAFPWRGRTIFQSVTGGMEHETRKADDLRDRYLERLNARKDTLQDLARRTGWQYHCHHSDAPAASALLWLYQALERSPR